MKKNTTLRPIFIFAPGIMAGAEKVVSKGLNALQILGYNPLFILINESRNPQFALEFKKSLINIDIIEIESHSAIDFSLYQKIRDTLLNLKGEYILHTHGYKALILTYLANKRNFSHVHTHHGDTSHTKKVIIYEFISRIIMKKCDGIIAVSHEMKKQLEKSLTNKTSITTIENMLTFDNISEAKETRRIFLNESTNKIKIIYIGRLSLEKGLIPFLNAFNQVTNKENFEINILGDGPLMAVSQDFINKNKLNKMIKLHGYVNNPKEYLSKSHLLIMPSLREGLPLTLIEALTIGVPVLANKVGALSGLIVQDKNGRLIDLLKGENNLEQWTIELNSIKLNIDRWSNYSLDHAEDFEKRFSIENWVNQTLAIYQQLLK